MRKSILSAMYGMAVHEGRINPDDSLGQLGIDDDPPLTEAEKRATVRTLLEARSDVYHGYVAGTPDMKVGRPARGAKPPETFWYYNNWDFNALGTIYERQTKSRIGAEFAKRLAGPLQMQDFRAEDMYYLRGASNAPQEDRSIYPAYHFRLSARDLARFGYLYLQKGNWNGKQIVPADWIVESTRSYSDFGKDTGYWYLWWVNGFDLPDKSFSARGALSKKVVVLPERGLVVVYLNYTEFPDNPESMTAAELEKLPNPTAAQFNQLLKMLLEAQDGKAPS